MSLRSWLEQSPFRGPTLLGKYLGVPVKTVEGWVYYGKVPTRARRLHLFLLTGISDFSPRNRGEREELGQLRSQIAEETLQRVRSLEAAVEDLWEGLEYFLLSDGQAREVLEEHIGEEELEEIGRVFHLLANKDRFSTWRAFRGLQETLRRLEP
jgi:hypothetical protein